MVFKVFLWKVPMYYAGMPEALASGRASTPASIMPYGSTGERRPNDARLIEV